MGPPLRTCAHLQGSDAVLNAVCADLGCGSADQHCVVLWQTSPDVQRVMVMTTEWTARVTDDNCVGNTHNCEPVEWLCNRLTAPGAGGSSSIVGTWQCPGLYGGEINIDGAGGSFTVLAGGVYGVSNSAYVCKDSCEAVRLEHGVDCACVAGLAGCVCGAAAEHCGFGLGGPLHARVGIDGFAVLALPCVWRFHGCECQFVCTCMGVGGASQAAPCGMCVRMRVTCRLRRGCMHGG